MSRRECERQVALLRNGAADGQEQAARALNFLAGPAATPPTRPRSVRPAASRRSSRSRGRARPAARGGPCGCWRASHDNPANQAAIREAGGIPPLVALLTQGPNGGSAAVEALRNLAYNNPANQAAIVAAGAVGPLVALVRVGAIRLGGHSREAEWALKMLDLAAIASRLQTLQAEEASRKRLRAPPPPRAGPGEECVVCFERARAVAFLPSGHFCVCSKCGQRLSECPICRKSTRKQRIYT